MEPINQTTLHPDDLGPIFHPDEWTWYASEGGPTLTHEVK